MEMTRNQQPTTKELVLWALHLKPTRFHTARVVPFGKWSASAVQGLVLWVVFFKNRGILKLPLVGSPKSYTLSLRSLVWCQLRTVLTLPPRSATNILPAAADPDRPKKAIFFPSSWSQGEKARPC